MKNLILEGVAGTGKSTLITKLKTIFPEAIFIEEDTTTGNLVEELRNPALSDEDRCKKLVDLLAVVEAHVRNKKQIILERFHPTYFALMPNWDLVKEIDKKISGLNFVTVLLDLPNEELESRTFDRPEMNWSEDLVKFYGSKEQALSAFQSSQQNRREFCQKTRMPVLTINTSYRNWDNYLEKIQKFLR